jgi:sensor histidine kinase regulating citrate/malate metabolism
MITKITYFESNVLLTSLIFVLLLWIIYVCNVMLNKISDKKTQKNFPNPIVKMIEDKRSIVKAIREGKDLSKLKGINLVNPI